jgi:hypothetical protein
MATGVYFFQTASKLASCRVCALDYTVFTFQNPPSLSHLKQMRHVNIENFSAVRTKLFRVEK